MMDSQNCKYLSTDVADVVGDDRIMDGGIVAVGHPAAFVSGPAYTVQCTGNDNSMVHGAVYCAPPGSVIVVQTDGMDFAVAGGNVCAVALNRGVAGMVIDGAIRDGGEIRDLGFPVFARGLYPKPGIKDAAGAMAVPVVCGGVTVNTGDVVVADQEGIAVIPGDEKEILCQKILARKSKEAATSFERWQAGHFAAIDALMMKKEVAEWKARNPNGEMP